MSTLETSLPLVTQTRDARSPEQSLFRVNNFDLLRLFAATQVLLFHTLHRLSLATPAWLQPLEALPGVPIFFVISGYLISNSYERQHGNLKNYFRNRCLRIYPALWVCIALTVLVVLFFGYRFRSVSDYMWLAAQPFGLIYTPRFLDTFGSGTYNGSLWTIPLELQFYCLVPLVYYFAKRLTNSTRHILVTFFAFLAIACVLAYLFPTADHETRVAKAIRYTFMPQFYLFLFGMLLQRLQIFRSPAIRNKGIYWLTFYVLLSHYLPLEPIVQVAAHLLLGVTIISLAYTLPDLSARFLRGQDISYGIYIYHGLFINVLVQLHRTGHYAYVPLVFVASVSAAVCSWYLIESPMLRRKHHERGRAARSLVGTEAVTH